MGQKEQRIRNRSWSLGEIIRYLREKQRISLEQLSQGVCSVSTLSRVENNIRVLNFLPAQRLLGRLGWKVSEFESYCNDKEFQCYQNRMEISALRKQKNFAKMKHVLKNYKMQVRTSKTDLLQQQFIKGKEALLEIEEGRLKEGISLIQEAISLTVFGWKEKKDSLLGFEELELFGMLADAYERLEEREKAYEIWIHLLKDFEQSEERKKQMAEPYTYVISKMVPYLLNCNMAKKGVELCEKGLLTVSDTLRGNSCCELLYWKAKCIRNLFQHGKVEKAEAMQSYEFAYFVCISFGKLEQAQEMDDYRKGKI